MNAALHEVSSQMAKHASGGASKSKIADSILKFFF
jgi:hypothetical protein